MSFHCLVPVPAKCFAGLCLFLALGAAAWAAEPAPPEVVARVGDEVITGAEFQRDLAYRARRTEVETGHVAQIDAEFRRKVMDELIHGRILRILAKNAGITVSDEEIQKEFAAGKITLGSEEAYQAYLKREGMTEDGVKAELRNRLVTEKWIQQQTKEVSVTDEEMKTEYQEWVKDGMATRPKQTVDFAHILIRANEKIPASMEAAKKKVETARARIDAGERFQDVAKELSEDPVSAPLGGVYEEASQGQMLPEIQERTGKLPIGEVSEPFKSRLGWHIMVVLARNEPGQITFERLKDRVRNAISSAKKQHTLDQLVDEARNVLKIEIEKAPESK